MIRRQSASSTNNRRHISAATQNTKHAKTSSTRPSLVRIAFTYWWYSAHDMSLHTVSDELRNSIPIDAVNDPVKLKERKPLNRLLILTLTNFNYICCPYSKSYWKVCYCNLLEFEYLITLPFNIGSSNRLPRHWLRPYATVKTVLQLFYFSQNKSLKQPWKF